MHVHVSEGNVFYKLNNAVLVPLHSSQRLQMQSMAV